MATQKAPHLTELNVRTLNEALRRLWDALQDNTGTQAESTTTTVGSGGTVTVVQQIASHAHDSRYYQKTEIDAFLALYYTSLEVDALLANYYTQTEVDTLVGGKADDVHGHRNTIASGETWTIKSGYEMILSMLDNAGTLIIEGRLVII